MAVDDAAAPRVAVPRRELPSEEERAQVAALQRGDARAFEAVVRAHSGRLLQVAARYLRDDEAARDCVQEALLSAYRAIGRFDGTCRLYPWLRRITINRALMMLRKRRRTRETSIDALLPRFDETGHLLGPTSTNTRSADEILADRGNAARVRQAIDALPEPYRAILLLRDVDGVETEEAASMLGISYGAAKVRLHRARSALRTLVAELFRAEEP